MTKETQRIPSEEDPESRDPRDILEELLATTGYTLDARVEPHTSRRGSTINYTIFFATKGAERVRLGESEAILDHLKHYLETNPTIQGLIPSLVRPRI